MAGTNPYKCQKNDFSSKSCSVRPFFKTNPCPTKHLTTKVRFRFYWQYWHVGVGVNFLTVEVLPVLQVLMGESGSKV